jgi:hypothetical protein
MVDYACRVWRTAARFHVRKLQGVTKCLRIATDAHSHVCDKHIHEDLDFPFFRRHVIELTERFDSKFASMEETVSRTFGRHLCCLTADQSLLSP